MIGIALEHDNEEGGGERESAWSHSVEGILTLGVSTGPAYVAPGDRFIAPYLRSRPMAEQTAFALAMC